MSTEFIVLGAIIITLLVLIISAINTVLIATALYQSQQKQRNMRRTSRFEGSRNNAIHF